jgi:hypothetical protein
MPSFTNHSKGFCSVDKLNIEHFAFTVCFVLFLSASLFVHTMEPSAFLLTCHFLTFQITGQVNFSFVTYINAVIDLILLHHQLQLMQLLI